MCRTTGLPLAGAVDWDLSGSDVSAPVEAAGILRRLVATGNSNAKPVVFSYEPERPELGIAQQAPEPDPPDRH